MSTVSLNEWLRTAVLGLLAALLLDHVVTTTPTSTVSGTLTPGTTATSAQQAPAERRRDPRRTRGLFVHKLVAAARVSQGPGPTARSPAASSHERRGP